MPKIGALTGTCKSNEDKATVGEDPFPAEGYTFRSLCMMTDGSCSRLSTSAACDRIGDDSLLLLVSVLVSRMGPTVESTSLLSTSTSSISFSSHSDDFTSSALFAFIVLATLCLNLCEMTRLTYSPIQRYQHCSLPQPNQNRSRIKGNVRNGNTKDQ